MSSELQPSFSDKVELLREQHFPFVEKSELVEAVYEVPNLGPMDFYTAGVPKFRKVAGVMLLSALYIALVYAGWQTGFFLPGPTLDRALVAAIVIGLLVTAGFMWIFISLNWGTFQRYVRVIDYRWRHIDRRPDRKGEFRVKRIVQLWPMAEKRLDRYAELLEDEIYKERLMPERQIVALPGVGPKTEASLKALGIDSLPKVARADPDVLVQIKGITPEIADMLIASARGIIQQDMERGQKLEDEKIEKKVAAGIEGLEEMEKLSSTYKLDRMIRHIRGITEPPEMRDPVREAISLKMEFVRIVRSLDSNFVYSIMECESNLYILVISRFSLTGGDDEENATGFVEFKDHSMTQRTFVWQGVNERATWGVFTHLADYKYLEIPSDKMMLLGKEERIKYAPICFLNYCDGQAEMDDEQIRKERRTPTGADILQAELIYGASVAEKGLEQIKLLTATVSRLKETISEIWREAMDWAKSVIAKAVEKILLEEKLRQGPGLKTWLVNLFSTRAVRMVVMLLGLVGLYLLVGYVVSVIWPHILWWPWNEMAPENGGASPEPYNP